MRQSWKPTNRNLIRKAEHPGKLARHSEAQWLRCQVNEAVVQRKIVLLSGEICSERGLEKKGSTRRSNSLWDWAEVSRSHSSKMAGKASEALQSRKAEIQIGRAAKPEGEGLNN